MSRSEKNGSALRALKQRYARGEITRKEFLEVRAELEDEDEERNYRMKTGASGAGKLLGFLVLVGIILVLLYLLGNGYLNPLISLLFGKAVHPTVTVSGLVTTIGFGTHPVSVSFGNSMTLVSSGYYSISLKNYDTYPVNVAWSGPLGIDQGTCSYGTLYLQSNSSTYMYNISC